MCTGGAHACVCVWLRKPTVCPDNPLASPLSDRDICLTLSGRLAKMVEVLIFFLKKYESSAP